MFWETFEPKNTKEIVEALHNESSTLDTFLQLDDIANEIKINSELANHFGPAYVQGLIDYVTQMPKETDTTLRKFRFPFVAAEILKADCRHIHNLMFSLNPEEEAKKSPSNDSDVQFDDLNSPVKDESNKEVNNEVLTPSPPKKVADVALASPTVVNK